MTSLSGQTLANPTGAQVVNGSVQINAIANQLNIHNSPGAIINWQNFSIGQQEITRFIQQNGTSAVLNRVLGQNPSAIMGKLLSNGHVFLLNPNGVVFGANAVVDTAGLVASSLNMSDESFLSGKYQFSGDASNGAVINRGLITTGKGGEVVLIAPTVENHGVISVEGGNILLAAGEKMTLSSLDLQGIEFEVQAPANKVMNLGKLLAHGGSVGVFAGSLSNTGVINANSVTQGKDGKLWLEASHQASIGGKLSAPDITIAGSDISLKDAEISASTAAGGGQVRIGGDYQGAALGPDVANAKTVTIDSKTTISANAQTQGDGGRVIVWSEENTIVNGHISATGGRQSGDGGFVETSGKRQLDFTTPVDVSASNGQAGTWLIDPEDITIDAGKASSIETALNAGSNVDIKTSDTGEGEGNITVASAITKSEGADATLSLDAHNKIDVNAPITSTSNKLNVKLTAGNQVNVNSNISSNGGSVATVITGTTTTAETTTEPVTEPVAEPTTDSSTDTASEPATDTDTTTAETTTDTSTEPSTDTTTEPTPETDAAASTVVASLDSAATESTPTATEGEELVELNTSITGIIETSGGDISIDAGETGSVSVSGTLDASNLDAGETGGNIEVLGDQVELAGDALLDASGDAGGGTIKVGGDYQGEGDTPTATNTTVAEGVLIKADTVTEGDGGNVFVWSDDTTIFHGKISARGGEQGGNGGQAEISGKSHLLNTGMADLSAAKGEFGTLLLDPGTVLINTDPDSGLDTFNNVLLGNQLNLANVTILTSAATVANGVTQNIEVDAPVSWSSGSTLLLVSGVDTNINAAIDGGAAGTFEVLAGGDINIANTISADTVTLEHSGAAGNSDTLCSGACLVTANTINLHTSGSVADANNIATGLAALQTASLGASTNFNIGSSTGLEHSATINHVSGIMIVETLLNNGSAGSGLNFTAAGDLDLDDLVNLAVGASSSINFESTGGTVLTPTGTLTGQNITIRSFNTLNMNADITASGGGIVTVGVTGAGSNLVVNGNINAGGSDVLLETAAGGAGAMTLNGALNNINDLQIDALGTAGVTEVGGTIVATNFILNSSGPANLNNANSVTNLNASITGAGSPAFVFQNDVSLNLYNPGVGSALTALGAVTLNLAGDLTQSSEIVVDGLLTVIAGDVLLNDANNSISSVDIASNGAVGVQLTSGVAGTLTINNINATGGGNVNVQNNGAISLNGPITTTGASSVTLDALGLAGLGNSITGAGLITSNNVFLQTSASSSGFVGTFAQPIQLAAVAGGTTNLEIGEATGSVYGAHVQQTNGNLIVDALFNDLLPGFDVERNIEIKSDLSLSFGVGVLSIDSGDSNLVLKAGTGNIAGDLTLPQTLLGNQIFLEAEDTLSSFSIGDVDTSLVALIARDITFGGVTEFINTSAFGRILIRSKDATRNIEIQDGAAAAGNLTITTADLAQMSTGILQIGQSTDVGRTIIQAGTTVTELDVDATEFRLENEDIDVFGAIDFDSAMTGTSGANIVFVTGIGTTTVRADIDAGTGSISGDDFSFDGGVTVNIDGDGGFPVAVLLATAEPRPRLISMPMRLCLRSLIQMAK